MKAIFQLFPKSKIRFTILCFFTFFSVSTFSQPWVYDFGTASSVFNTVNSSSTSFLPTPSSGTARVRIGNNGGSFNLNNPGLTDLGSGSELNAIAASSSSVNKMSIYDYTAYKSFYTRFFIRFDGGTSGTWYFFQGNGNSFSDNNTFSNNEVFSGIKWIFGANGTISLNYRNGSSWVSPGNNPFRQSATYKIEIYGNNTTSTISYAYNNCSSNSLAPDKWDIWVNGNLAGDDVSKSGLPNNSDIDSWMFYSENSTGNVANIYLDDITYSNSIPQSVFEPLYQPTSLSFSNTTYNGFNVHFTPAAGEPDAYLVLRKPNSFPTSAPSDSMVYFTGDTIGDAVVAYSGSNDSFSDTLLYAGISWYYSVFAYNGNSACNNYKTNSPLQGSHSTAATGFFTKSTGDLQLLSSWGSNPDGSGTSPVSFSNAASFYYVMNRSYATISGNLIISGSGSKLIVGNNISLTEFLIPASCSYSGNIDVSGNAKLTILNTTIPNIDRLFSGSSVEYAASSSQNIAINNYYHLKISSGGLKSLLANTSVNGTFTISGSASLNSSIYTLSYGNNATLEYSGSSVQTTTSNEFPTSSGPANLTINNNSGVILHDSRTLAGTLNINSGDLDLNNNTLIINGNITGNGTFTGSNTSSLQIGGSGYFGNLSFNTSTLSKRTLDNFTIDRPGGIIHLNSGLRIHGTLTISNGILEAGNNSLDASAGIGNLLMTNGVLRLSKLNTVLPELNGTYNLSGGSLEFYGNGNQYIRSNRTYNNLNISCHDTLRPGGGPVYMNSGATLAITASPIVDVQNNSFCSGNTNFTMSGGRFRSSKLTTAQPEMDGNYSLSGGIVELYGSNNSQQQTIRSAKTYYNIEINATLANTNNSNVKQGSGNICIINEFRIKSGAVYSVSDDAITDGGNTSSFVMEPGATLKYGSAQGINITGNTGNIRTDNRSFPVSCSYGFCGGVNMLSGDGLPSALVNLFISKTAGKITLSNNLTVTNLTVLSGTLEIQPNKYLKINNTLINSVGFSGLVLKSSSSGTASLIHQTTGVKGTAERFVPVVQASKYHYLSSAVDSAQGRTILDPLYGNYNAYFYNPALSGNINSRWVRTFPNDLLRPGLGYIIPYCSTSAGNKTIQFAGSFNTGSFTVPISSVSGNWNLVGNPYPCAISANDFITENAVNHNRVMGSLYFWDDDASGGSGYTTSDYACWNGTGSIGNVQTPNGNIGTGQAFFVESTGSDNIISFSNSMKSTSNTQFFIPGNYTVKKIKLSISGSGKYNETLIGFLADATPEFDNFYDGKKLSGNPEIALYSLISGDTNKFSIQGLPPLSKKVEIPIGFDVGSSGNYVLKLKNTESFGSGRILLEDKVKGLFIDLCRDSFYHFYSASGNYKNRFILAVIPFDKYTTEVAKELNNQFKIKTIYADNFLHIFAETEFPKKGNIRILNLTGQLLLSQEFQSAGIGEILEFPLKPGYYLLSISTEAGIETKKMICW